MTRSLRADGFSVRYALDPTVDCVLLVDPRPGPTASFDVLAIEEARASNPRLAVIQRVNDNDKHRGSDNRDRVQAGAAHVADYTVFVSKWLRDYEAATWFDTSRPHGVIWNGADSAHFHPDGGSAWRPGQPMRLVTHHWSKQWSKGFDVYAEVDRLIADGFLPDVELWVIGRWPDELQWRSARTFPPVRDVELASLLRQCHVYVTASRWESGGMHFIEGAQCGLPVLYHPDGGGIVEVAQQFGLPMSADVAESVRSMRQRYSERRAAALETPPSGERMCAQYRALIRQVTLKKRGHA